MAPTWIKVDDTMVEHPKCVGLSPAAWTLWLHGVSYCSRNLTDGHIPRVMLARLSSVSAPTKAAGELVAAGLWHAVDGGYVVHDYLEHQRSRADVAGDRAKAAERQRRSRQNRDQVTAVSRNGHGVTPSAESESESESDTHHHPLTTHTEPVDNPRIEEVAEAVISQRLTRQTGVRNPTAWRRTAMTNLRADLDWWADLERIVAKWPTAPVDMLAAAAEGNCSPNLNHYRRSGPADTQGDTP